MRNDTRLEIFGEINSPELLDTLAARALEVCEDARDAIADDPETDDMVTVVGYISGLTAQKKRLELFVEDSRYDFEDVREDLRREEVGYRMMSGHTEAGDYTESSVWRPGWNEERTIAIDGGDRPVVALADVEYAIRQGSAHLDAFVGRARSASILDADDVLVLSEGVVKEWMAANGHLPDVNTPARA